MTMGGTKNKYIVYVIEVEKQMMLFFLNKKKDAKLSLYIKAKPSFQTFLFEE